MNMKCNHKIFLKTNKLILTNFNYCIFTFAYVNLSILVSPFFIPGNVFGMKLSKN